MHRGMTRPTQRVRVPQPAPAAAPRVLWVARAVTVVVTLCFLGLIGRTVQLQTQPHPNIAAMLGTQRSTVALDAPRGDLRDRQGRILATTQVDHVLFIDTALVEDLITFPDHVVHQLGYDPYEVNRALFRREESRYIVLDPSMTAKHRAAYEAAEIEGLAAHTNLSRQYPHGPVAGQLLGFATRDQPRPDAPLRVYGKEGLEYAMDDILAGRAGSLSYYRTASRTPVWVNNDDYNAPRFGQDVRLSVDVIVQAIAEKHLAATCEQFEAKAGQVVVMDPHSGEILAMANWPAWDPRQPGKPVDGALLHEAMSDAQRAALLADLRRNRCVSDPFEPGSIFKPFVWAALLDAGVVRADELIDCHGGAWSPFRGRTLHDAHGYGKLTWEEVLIKSSNIGMAVAARRIGPERLHDLVRTFGFGEETGSRLPGESPGIVNPKRRWNKWSTTSVPMGQEIATTALQVTNAFCAIANDGLMVRPRIIAVDPTSPVEQVQLIERVIEHDTAQLTRQTLRRVVTEGTGRRAQSDLFEIFGKTGTAQVPNRDRQPGEPGYLPDTWMSSFVCGAPTDRPRIVVGVFIHEPDVAKGYYGGTVAGPAAKQIVEETLVYLGVPTLKELRGEPLVRH